MLLIDPMSYQYLVGAEIDYTEGLEGAQFVIKNLTPRHPAAAARRSRRPRASVRPDIDGRPAEGSGARFSFRVRRPPLGPIDGAQHARAARAGHRRQIAWPSGKRFAREPRERQRLDVADRDAIRRGRRERATA